jgi:hypothetical protein
MTDKLDSKLLLALVATVLALTIAVASTPQGVGKADQLIPMNHVPAEASACNVG